MGHRITVLGTGTMALGIAAGFIAENCTVTVLGRTADKASDCLNKAKAMADSLQANDAALTHQSGAIDSWSNWADADLIVETVSEDLALKQRLFAMMDKCVSAEVPIGSNSSAYPISEIAKGLPTANRMMGLHYFMPAEIVPLVEVVLGEKTDSSIAQGVCDLYRSVNKKPVLVKKDIPGFLANRIQHALMREALCLIDAGIASFEDVDDAVRYSFGFRYAAVGPMMQKELSGWDTQANAAKAIYPSLYNVSEIPGVLARMLHEGHSGVKNSEGYRKWTAEEIQEAKAQYQRRLRAAFNVLNMD
jgi:3-hydroxybutyryl-CoA dehydrogenase